MWGVRSQSLYSSWAAIELNLVILVPLILVSTINEGRFSSVKYLVIQRIAGISILTLLFLIDYRDLSRWWLRGLNLLFLYKLGAVPFYNWVLIVGESQRWWSLFFILTIQKALPLFFLQILGSSLVVKISVLSWALLPVLIVQIKTLKGILIISSTYILMAVITVTIIISYKWKFLLGLYSVSLIPILSLGGWTKGGRRGPKILEELSSQLSWLVLIVRILGLPPTPGFLLKVDISSTLIFLGLLIPVVIFNLGSGALIYIYLGLIISKIRPGYSLLTSANRLRVTFKILILMFISSWLII